MSHPKPRLMRTNRINVLGTGSKGNTDRPEVDCGPDRFLILRNLGPEALSLSKTAGGPASEVLDPPADWGADEVTLTGRRFLSCPEGRALVQVLEYQS